MPRAVARSLTVSGFRQLASTQRSTIGSNRGLLGRLVGRPSAVKRRIPEPAVNLLIPETAGMDKVAEFIDASAWLLVAMRATRAAVHASSARMSAP